MDAEKITKEDEYISKNFRRILWTEEAYKVLKEELLPEAPADCTITVGFPSSGGTSQNAKKVGECMYHFIKKGRETQHLITVHFNQFKDPLSVLDTLLHEMVHASGARGHGQEFSQLAKRVGLKKPWVSTTPTERLKEKFYDIVERIGEMPKGWGDINLEKKKQKSRLRKWVCECGVKVRVASDEFKAVCLECDTLFKLGV